MKKIALILLAALTACAMTVGLAGCGGGFSHNDAGTYNVYEISDGTMTVNNDLIKTLGMEDFMILELKADGTGKLTYDDQTVDITWQDGELKHGAEKITYKKDNGKIVIDIDGNKVVLKKK